MRLPRQTADLRPDWLTGGLLRLLALAAFIIAVGMVRPRLTHFSAGILVLVAGAAAAVGLLLFLGAARRLARRLPFLDSGLTAGVLAELRRVGLPLLGLAFFLFWTVVYVALWWLHPDDAFRGLADRPRFADFFYYAVSTAFLSPPGDVLAHSRGARSATMIEMLTAFALLGAYLSSFVDWRSSDPRRGEEVPE